MAVLGLALAQVAQAGVLYYDDFSGAGAVLNKTIPDITPTGTEKWTAADSDWKDNGYIGEWWEGYKEASLPFTPGRGVYTLSVDMDADPNNVEYYNLDLIGITFGAGPGIKIYDNAAGDVYSTGGPSADVKEGSYGKGAIHVDIVLDTTAASWEVEWFVNSSSVRGPETYTTNPSTTKIVIWKDWMCGSWDNLSLTPEPATLALLGLGGLGLILGRKRK